MIEEILSLVRCYQIDFGICPKYLILGQNQIIRFLIAYQNKYGKNFHCPKVLDLQTSPLGNVGIFNKLNIIVVTSDIFEVV